jgi:hypothetical protein
MSAAVLEAPATLFAQPHEAGRAGGQTDGRSGGRGTTLAELLDDTWRAARGGAEAECPMCHAPMHLHTGTARCAGCGTTLT